MSEVLAHGKRGPGGEETAVAWEVPKQGQRKWLETLGSQLISPDLCR